MKPASRLSPLRHSGCDAPPTVCPLACQTNPSEPFRCPASRPPSAPDAQIVPTSFPDASTYFSPNTGQQFLLGEPRSISPAPCGLSSSPSRKGTRPSASKPFPIVRVPDQLS